MLLGPPPDKARQVNITFNVPEYKIAGWNTPDTEDFKKDESIFSLSSNLAVAIRRRAHAFSTPELKLWKTNKDGEPEEVIESPALTLFRRPNEFMTGREFRFAISAWWDLTGNAFLVFDPNKKEILIPRTAQMKVIPDKNDFIAGYIYFPNPDIYDQAIPIPKELVLHIKDWNPADPWYGMSRVRSGDSELALDYYSTEWNKKFFENGAMPAGIIQVKGLSNEKQWRQFREAWYEEHGTDGGKNLNNLLKMAFVNENINFIKAGDSQKDMEMNLMRRYEREQILAMMDVPPMLGGVFEFANYANAREQRRSFWLEGIIPRLKFFEDALNEIFIPRFRQGNQGFYFEHDLSEVEALQETFRETVDSIVPLWNSGLIKRNLALAKLGLESVPDEENDYKQLGLDFGFSDSEDETLDMSEENMKKKMDRILRQRAPGLFSGQSVSQPKIIINNAPSANGYQSRQEVGLETLEIPASDSENYRSWMWKRFDRSLRKQEQLMAETVVRFMNLQLKRVLKRMDEYLGRSAKKRETLFSEDMAGFIFDLIVENGQLTDALTRRYRIVIKNAATEALGDLEDAVPIEVDFDIKVERIAQYIAERTNLVKGINDITYRKLKEIVIQVVQEGKTVIDLRDEIRGMFKDMTAGRAMTIARTETVGAYNFGTVEAWRQSGVVQTKTWLSARDDRVRDSHKELDGETVPLDQIFSNGLEFPGQTGGAPGEVINCRCNLLSKPE